MTALVWAIRLAVFVWWLPAILLAWLRPAWFCLLYACLWLRLQHVRNRQLRAKASLRQLKHPD